MKRFVTYFAMFTAMVVALLLAAEAVVRHHPNSYKYKDAWMTRNGGRVSTLVLGGSHSYYGVDASLLGDSAFNLANVSQHPEYDYFVLRRYGDRCPRLRRVIVVVDAVNIFDPPIEQLDGDRARATAYRLYMDCDKHSRCSRYGMELFNLREFNRKLLPSLRHLLRGDAQADCDTLGRFNRHDSSRAVSVAELERTALKAAERHRCTDYRHVAYNCAWLDSIGDYCRRRGIDIVVLTPPAYSTYRKHIPQRQRDTMRAVAAKFARSYHARRVDLFDADSTFTAECYLDADHLNREGASRLSNLLVSKVGQ